MSTFGGLRGTGDFSADERPKNFRELIHFRNPNGSAPIFAMTSKAGKKSVDDAEFSWWDEPNDIIRLQVNGSHAAGATLITVDSLDPTDTAPDRVYGTATNLKEGDMLMVEAADTAVWDGTVNEVLLVQSVQSATQFTALRGFSATTAATIGDNVFLTLIGSAYAEGTSVPRAVGRNPVKYSNKIQIFKDTYELTGTVNETNLRTGNAWSNDKKRKMFKHSVDIEMALLFGRMSETIGSNGKPLRTMGGLRDYIPNDFFSVAATIDTLYDKIAPVFDFDSEAGDTRLAFGGNQCLSEINKLVIAATNAKMELGNVVKIYGRNFRELVLHNGRVLFSTHPLLSRHALYKKSLLILDFSSIKYTTMKNRDTKMRDDVQAKDEDLRRGYIQTDCSLMVDSGGLTNKYIGNISAT
jgi:hypothetical protein